MYSPARHKEYRSIRQFSRLKHRLLLDYLFTSRAHTARQSAWFQFLCTISYHVIAYHSDFWFFPELRCMGDEGDLDMKMFYPFLSSSSLISLCCFINPYCRSIHENKKARLYFCPKIPRFYPSIQALLASASAGPETRASHSVMSYQHRTQGLIPSFWIGRDKE